jgi:hypothetical protein
MAEVTRTIAAAGMRQRVGTVEVGEHDLETEDLGWSEKPTSRSNWGP